jgi:hypothetical protein
VTPDILVISIISKIFMRLNMEMGIGRKPNVCTSARGFDDKDIEVIRIDE